MKSIRTIIPCCLLLIVFTVAITETRAQSKVNSTGYTMYQWRHQDKYNRITSGSVFNRNMSDDEMAGIYLWRGGRNLKTAFALEMIGVLVGTSASWLPNLASGKKGSIDATTVSVIIGVVSTGLFVAGLCELVSGYNKIGKAGIILQHKKFSFKTTGTSVSLNF